MAHPPIVNITRLVKNRIVEYFQNVVLRHITHDVFTVEIDTAQRHRSIAVNDELAVDMAIELCQLDPGGSTREPLVSDDQPQVSDHLLASPKIFSPTDQAPGEDAVLDALWSECGAGDPVSCDDLFYSAPRDSTYEQFAFSCGGRANMDCSLLLGRDQPEGALTSLTPPPGEDEDLDRWWARCAKGSARACGELRLVAPSQSLYAQFGTSCGARGTSYCTLILDDDGEPPTLRSLTPDQTPPGQDELLDHLWELCGDRDARACKDLSKFAPIDSLYMQFGVSCGGRAVAPCPRLFADLEA
jgi:hypothetical protein